MYRKINIKQLATLFVIMLALVVLVLRIDSRKGNRTFKKDLIEVENEAVTSIEIFPKVTGGKKIRLFRENNQWMVESQEKKYIADATVAGSLLDDLNQASPESVVAKKKERWDDFEVTDSLGTRVKLYAESELLADLIIGKFTFSQTRKMTSFVRLADEKEVYGVDGMLGMSFNRNLNTFRNRTVIGSNSTDWRRLTFDYPADSSFTLQKKAKEWTINDQPADSALVAEYFSSVSNLTSGKFAQNEPAGAATHRLTIEGDNQMETIKIKGFYLNEDHFILESSQNRGNFFDDPELAKKIFISPF